MVCTYTIFKAALTLEMNKNGFLKLFQNLILCKTVTLEMLLKILKVKAD
jgi:hypothetical protein